MKVTPALRQKMVGAVLDLLTPEQKRQAAKMVLAIHLDAMTDEAAKETLLLDTLDILGPGLEM